MWSSASGSRSVTMRTRSPSSSGSNRSCGSPSTSTTNAALARPGPISAGQIGAGRALGEGADRTVGQRDRDVGHGSEATGRASGRPGTGSSPVVPPTTRCDSRARASGRMRSTVVELRRSSADVIAGCGSRLARRSPGSSVGSLPRHDLGDLVRRLEDGSDVGAASDPTRRLVGIDSWRFVAYSST